MLNLQQRIEELGKLRLIIHKLNRHTNRFLRRINLIKYWKVRKWKTYRKIIKFRIIITENSNKFNRWKWRIAKKIIKLNFFNRY